MKAYFSGGCFWCMTPVFKVYGVSKVVCGYSGNGPRPDYLSVKSQTTGFREAIELEYDPNNTKYEKLVDIFLANIDPFDGEGQYIDRGFSYTTAIYYQNDFEKETANSKIRELELKYGKETKISVEPFVSFYIAEEEHQDYYLKNPEAFEREMKDSGRIKN